MRKSYDVCTVLHMYGLTVVFQAHHFYGAKQIKKGSNTMSWDYISRVAKFDILQTVRLQVANPWWVTASIFWACC